MNRDQIASQFEQKNDWILDGAIGTELERRGFPLTSPGWSASAIRNAPKLLKKIHSDYVDAGADIVTANTFRTHQRNLVGTSWDGESRQLTIEAVQIAREAANGKALVAGSIAPLEDCYSPELTPPPEEIVVEHKAMIAALKEARVDLVLVETQLTIRESTAIAKLLAEADVPFLISFVARRDGTLLSGESLSLAFESVSSFDPLGYLLNCLPANEVTDCLISVSPKFGQRTLGIYANTGRRDCDGYWETTTAISPAVYAEFIPSWRSLGVTVFGGCCGTTPEHIKLIKKTVYND